MPNGMPIGSAVFVWIPNAMLYNALSVGKKPPNCLFRLGFRHPAGEGPSHGHEATRTEKLVKIVRVFPEISSGTDRQTDTHTDELNAYHSFRHRSRGRSNKQDNRKYQTSPAVLPLSIYALLAWVNMTSFTN